MFKLILLVLGLAIGFGGGVYWATHNPDAAGKLSNEEERRFLTAQLAVIQKMQTGLEQVASRSDNSKVSGSGFISTGQSKMPSVDVNQLRTQMQQQQDELKRRLEKLK